jgi:energy-coupling factor transporter transmembrane protein EcfT
MVQCLVALDVGFLGAASCVAFAKTLDAIAYSHVFAFARWVSRCIGGALGSDSHRASHDLLGFAVQQATVGFLLAATIYMMLSWMRSRQPRDRLLFRLAGAVASMVPWLTLVLVAATLPTTPRDFVAYGAMALAVGLSAYWLRLIEAKLWSQNKVGVALGALAILLLWMSLASLTSGIEKLTVWGSFIVSVLVVLVSISWYLSTSDPVSATTSS